MFDLNRLCKLAAWGFLAYFVSFPILGLAIVTIGGSALNSAGDALTWPVPVIFCVVSLVLVGDLLRRLGSHDVTVTQVTGYRFVALLQVLGGGFALGRGYWWPAVVCGVAWLGLLAVPKARAEPSTWAPR